jgi:hypothetical protein
MSRERLNVWYEASDSIWPIECCIGTLDRYKTRYICGNMPVNETVETSVIPTCVSLELKTDGMSNKPLYIEKAVRFKHQM